MLKLFNCLLTIAIVTLSLPSVSLAQGCSDAGLCTLEGMQSAEALSAPNRLGVGFGFAQGEQAVSILNQQVSYSRVFTEKLSIGLKLTHAIIDGELGSNSGLGDLFIDLGMVITPQSSVFLGVKLPLSKADAKRGSVYYPMVYQTSLETVDLLLGATLTRGDWAYNLGLQQPLTGANSNGFEPLFDADPRALNYLGTNEFNRKGDILFRCTYTTELADNARFKPSLLLIQHLGEDRVILPLGEEVGVAGSDGLTVNVNAEIEYPVENLGTLSLQLGFPVKARDARPDGLTREYVFNLGFAREF